MDILYASSSAIPSRFANSINVMKMCHSFAGLGHAVELMAPRMAEEEGGVGDIFGWYGIGENFKLRRVHALSYPHVLGRAIYAASCAWRIRSDRPKIVYGRDWPALLLAVGQARVVLELHAPPPASGVKGALFERLLKHPNLVRVVVNTVALRDEVLKTMNGVAKPVVLAPNGADPVPRQTAPSKLVVRRDGRMIVGYAGHLYPGRGMELLSELASLCPFADFHVVGGWPQDVAFWQERLQGIPNVYLHGHVSPVEVPPFLCACDVLIAPYQPVVGLYQGQGDNSRWVCPIKLFEYMSSGKPIICSDLPVLREFVEHNVTGLLCPPTDARAWAAAIERLKNEPGLGERLGTAAFSMFSDRYSWDARARTVLQGIEALGP
jgi:glycosyltransferase involved in cell wall biosynthesis